MRQVGEGAREEIQRPVDTVRSLATPPASSTPSYGTSVDSWWKSYARNSQPLADLKLDGQCWFHSKGVGFVCEGG